MYVPINKQFTIIKNYLDVSLGIARERVKNFRGQNFVLQLRVEWVCRKFSRSSLSLQQEFGILCLIFY